MWGKGRKRNPRLDFFPVWNCGGEEKLHYTTLSVQTAQCSQLHYTALGVQSTTLHYAQCAVHYTTLDLVCSLLQHTAVVEETTAV